MSTFSHDCTKDKRSERRATIHCSAGKPRKIFAGVAMRFLDPCLSVTINDCHMVRIKYDHAAISMLFLEGSVEQCLQFISRRRVLPGHARPCCSKLSSSMTQKMVRIGIQINESINMFALTMRFRKTIKLLVGFVQAHINEFHVIL
jgi:hypothetical protein